MTRIIKTVVVVIYILVFAGLLILQIWGKISGFLFDVSSLFYWIILIGWVGFVWDRRLQSYHSMRLGFSLFIVGVILTTFGLKVIAEPVLKLCFIGWIVGFVQAFIEYNKRGMK